MKIYYKVHVCSSIKITTFDDISKVSLFIFEFQGCSVLEVSYLWFPRFCSFKAILSWLKVIISLIKFIIWAQHKRSTLVNWFVYRFSSQHNELSWSRLRNEMQHLISISRVFKYSTLASFQQLFFILYLEFTFIDDYHWIPALWYYVLIVWICLHVQVYKVGRCPCLYRPFHSKYFSCYDLCFECVSFVYRYLFTLELLILRFAKLILFLKVNP